MTTIKHNFSLLQEVNNPILAGILEVNNANSFIFAYSIIILTFVVSSFVFIKRTQDVGKSLLSACYISTTSSLMLYYAGKLIGTDIVPDIVMLGLLIMLSLGIAGLRFSRMEGT